MKKTFFTDYGVITVRNAMIDSDGTNLQEGIVLADEDENLLEIIGYYDVDEMTVDEVESIIEGKLRN